MRRQKYRKRDPYKDYFIVQNDIFDMGLSPVEIAILVYLFRLDRKNDGYCFTNYSSVELYIGIGPKTIKKYIKSLEAKKAIKTEVEDENNKISFKKRDRSKNFFLLPNELFEIKLSSGEIAVYAYLLKCEDHKNYQCHPSYRTIGNNIGASINSVKKYVKALERKKLIFTVYTSILTQDNFKLNGNLLYTIRPFDEALLYYYSWFNKYPTKKAALNAILFTDFIIKAEKVNET